MDTNQTPENEREGWQHQGESLNTGSAEAAAQQNDQSEKKHSVGALQAAAAGRSATAQVDHHSDSGLANTGTNISYEGATAPGSGGSVGTGYASGKSAVDATISTSSDEDAAMAQPKSDGSALADATE